MNKIAYGIVVGALVISFGLIFSARPTSDTKVTGSNNADTVENVEIKDGVQYITIFARGGYSPRVSTAQAGMPSKLVVKTDGTYDCSLALVIRSIGYQKILSQSGEEVIDLGTPQKGTLQGLCSMGMYNFKINFE